MLITPEEILRSLLKDVAFEIKLNFYILRESDCMVNELRIIGDKFL